MCVCGCKKYLNQGEEAVVSRVKEFSYCMVAMAIALKDYERYGIYLLEI